MLVWLFYRDAADMHLQDFVSWVKSNLAKGNSYGCWKKAAKCIFLLHSSYGSSSLFGICGPFGFELGFNRV